MIPNEDSPALEKRILLVDMSPIVRKLMRRILKKAGFECDEAETGAEALQKVDKTYYHVVFTGLVFNDMTGPELIAKIRANDCPHYIYIIALSTQNSLHSIIDALESGADEFMEKPVKRPLLFARLKLAERIIEMQEKLLVMELQSQDILMKDALTEVYNRHRLKHDLPSEIERAKRYKKAFSLLICDIDHFKSINDTYGHLAGDKVLKEVAARIKGSIRNTGDWVARYGGEEFVIILPETEAELAYEISDRIRRAICDKPFTVTGNKEITVSMSVGAIGFSEIPEQGINQESILQRADLCLYNAKRSGRNRVAYEGCVMPNDSPKLTGPN